MDSLIYGTLYLGYKVPFLVYRGKMENYLLHEQVLFAFNIWDINSAKAVMDGAYMEQKNVILQTSSGIYVQTIPKQLREFVTSYSKELNIRAWLHLDHCRDVEIIKSAIRNGWDSVMIDASSQSIEHNIEITNQVIGYARENGVLVEAEIGQIKGIEDGKEVCMDAVASRADIDHFLSATDVDMIAVAFGNAHGMYKGEPDLQYDLIDYTGKKANKPFVVHGGSGLSDAVLCRLIHNQYVKKINISTDVKLAYLSGIEKANQTGLLHAEGFQAAKVDQCIHDTIVEMVRQKLQLIDQ